MDLNACNCASLNGFKAKVLTSLSESRPISLVYNSNILFSTKPFSTADDPLRLQEAVF